MSEQKSTGDTDTKIKKLKWRHPSYKNMSEDAAIRVYQRDPNMLKNLLGHFSIAEPFWTKIMRSLDVRYSTQCSTMGVRVKKHRVMLDENGNYSNNSEDDDKINLWKGPTNSIGCVGEDITFELVVNPLFLAGFRGLGKDPLHHTPEESVHFSKYAGDVKSIYGIFCHEMMHIFLQHVTNRRVEPHFLWNRATDLAINSLIEEGNANRLPDWCLLPGRASPLLTDEDYEDMRDYFSSLKGATPEKVEAQIKEAVDDYNMWSEFYKSCPPGLSSDEYLSLMLQNKNVREYIDKVNKRGAEIAAAWANGGQDDHDGWGQLTEEEAEAARRKLKDIFSRAARDSQNTKQWGTTPQKIKDMILEMMNGEVNWKVVLRNFAGKITRAERVSTVWRLNKKMPGLFPGHNRDYRPKLGVYIDQSGSVDDASLEALFGELSSLAKFIDITCYHFDTEVDEDSKLEIKAGRNNIMPTRTRCGGTDFDAPTRHANQNRGKIDGYIIMTDGYCNKPSSSRLRRAYLIIPSGELQFQRDMNDLLIQMKGISGAKERK